MNDTIKYISYLNEILKGHLTGKKVPILVTLCVTPRCNLRCIYCYKENSGKTHKEFSTEEVLNLIDELKDMGTKYISLNGGEALLRDDIGVIINKLKKKNLLSHLSTNGLLIRENIVHLKKINSLSISIDGIGESNDLNRGKGSYDRIMDSIDCLKSNNIKFHTHTVLTKNNKNAVEEMMPLARKYGFRAQFSTLRTVDSPDKSISLNDEELREVIERIINYKKAGFPLFFSCASYKNALDWPFTYDKPTISNQGPEGYKQSRCYIKRFSCHIEPDGLVYPCIVLVNKFKALNFLEVGFKKAWENLVNNECKACYNVCCNDLNLIFGLKPNSVWNAFKIVLDRYK